MSTIAATNLKNASSGTDNIVLGTDGSTRVSTLADSAGANTSTPAQIASGRAKAWVNFNGTGTVAIRTSFNVSSITDNGLGDYTINFTTAFADANYTANVTSGKPPGVLRSNSTIPHNTVPAAGSCRMGAYDGAQNAQQDAEFISVLFFR